MGHNPNCNQYIHGLTSNLCCYPNKTFACAYRAWRASSCNLFFVDWANFNIFKLYTYYPRVSNMRCSGKDFICLGCFSALSNVMLPPLYIVSRAFFMVLVDLLLFMLPNYVTKEHAIVHNKIPGRALRYVFNNPSATEGYLSWGYLSKKLELFTPYHYR
jgi:hypothetical protein